MSLSKLEKFAAIDEMPNVYQNLSFKDPKLVCQNSEVSPRENWKKTVFKNSNPLILELACGKGEYSVALAERYPQKNFLGVDIKGNRIYSGAKKALDSGLANVAFLRTRIELLHHFIARGEVDEVWITFPDPFPRFSDRGNRLISTKFLDYYRENLSSEPITYHFKTDNSRLFRYAMGVLDGRGIDIDLCVENIYGEDKVVDDLLKIETYYEKLHKSKGSAIHYMKWSM